MSPSHSTSNESSVVKCATTDVKTERASYFVDFAKGIFANGLSVSGKASAGCSCVYNIEPIADKSPPMYRATRMLSLGVPTLGDLSQTENMKPGEPRGIVDVTKGEVIIGTSDKRMGKCHHGGKWNMDPVSGASYSTEKLEMTVPRLAFRADPRPVHADGLSIGVELFGV